MAHALQLSSTIARSGNFQITFFIRRQDYEHINQFLFGGTCIVKTLFVFIECSYQDTAFGIGKGIACMDTYGSVSRYKSEEREDSSELRAIGELEFVPPQRDDASQFECIANFAPLAEEGTDNSLFCLVGT